MCIGTGREGEGKRKGGGGLQVCTPYMVPEPECPIPAQPPSKGEGSDRPGVAERLRCLKNDLPYGEEIRLTNDEFSSQKKRGMQPHVHIWQNFVSHSMWK